MTGPATSRASTGVYPGLLDLGDRMTVDEALAIIRNGQGYMPSHAHLSDDNLEALTALPL